MERESLCDSRINTVCLSLIFLRLHGPPMLVDRTNIGLVLCNHVNFYRFEETSSYWSVELISVFLCFSLLNQRHTSVITVYNRTMTNIENTVRAVQSCNSWFYFVVCVSNFFQCLGSVVLCPGYTVDANKYFIKFRITIDLRVF